MKIMITGCHGQLGNELQSILKSGKSEIGAAPQAVLNAEVFAVDIDTLDISDMKAVSDFVTLKKPDVIINCAAMTNVDGCESDYETAFKVNAVGVRNLAVCADSIGAKLVHVSTDYVFAGNGKKPYWTRLTRKAFTALQRRSASNMQCLFAKKHLLCVPHGFTVI